MLPPPSPPLAPAARGHAQRQNGPCAARPRRCLAWRRDGNPAPRAPSCIAGVELVALSGRALHGKAPAPPASRLPSSGALFPHWHGGGEVEGREGSGAAIARLAPDMRPARRWAEGREGSARRSPGWRRTCAPHGGGRKGGKARRGDRPWTLTPSLALGRRGGGERKGEPARDLGSRPLRLSGLSPNLGAPARTHAPCLPPAG